MKHLLLCFLITSSITACTQPQSKDRPVGGQCEGCEAIFELGSARLSPVDTLPDFNEDGPKLLLHGKIYQQDGKTPASDVILYIYHTDQKGLYTPDENSKGWEKRHGRIRGWIKTDADGTYAFYTLLPASYPNSAIPKHIHPTIKEPGLQAYWIDEFVFDDDPLLTEKQKSQNENRGGSGIVKPVKNKNGLLTAHRDIILGKNIPGY